MLCERRVSTHLLSSLCDILFLFLTCLVLSFGITIPCRPLEHISQSAIAVILALVVLYEKSY